VAKNGIQPLRKLYDGKAKAVYETADPDLLVIRFKDEAPGRRRGRSPRPPFPKGVYNCSISAALFRHLEARGVPTHFVRILSDRDLLVRRLLIIPIEVVIRNIVAGSLARRLGLEEGQRLDAPVLEFYYKSDALGDPMINESHVRVMGIATPEEVQQIKETALRINGHLLRYVEQRGLLLVDFKVEFGRRSGSVLLGDEITPDGCRFWEGTARRPAGDRRRRTLGRSARAYRELSRRIAGEPIDDRPPHA
jgi:phosphoribosylaminoimidazole-succinocarboxamide synthase